MKELSPQDIIRSIRGVEDIILSLDQAIESTQIDPKDLDKLKIKYQKAKDILTSNVDSTDSRLYVIDEADGLFSWISGNKSDASAKVGAAVVKKGDTHLISQAARGLAASSNVKAAGADHKPSDGSPVSGWLGFFYSTTTLIAIVLLLLAAGISASLFFPPVDRSVFVGVMITWTLTALSISYLVLAARRSRAARAIAIVLYGLLTLICLVILIAGVAYNSSLDQTDQGEITPMVSFFLFLIADGTAATIYFIRSSKVRQVFTR